MMKRRRKIKEKEGEKKIENIIKTKHIQIKYKVMQSYMGNKNNTKYKKTRARYHN